MPRFSIAVLVNNRFGVLNRVTSMFRRRRFNISSLTVCETEVPDYSRITVLFEGDERSKAQLVNQLYKLPDVVTIKEFDPDESVSRELLLIKIVNTPESRDSIRAISDAFKAKTVDYSREAVTLQITGNSRKIDEVIGLLRDFGILEVCRTGIVSLDRGGAILRDDLE